ncbi:MAG TPA: hypothetical protein VF628_02340 [Allosphingosinicella sp.]|jgi:hypothetical protein
MSARIEIEPFAPDHLAQVRPQDAQAPELAALGGLDAVRLGAAHGPAFTALRDGRAIGCAGLIETPYGASAWALFGRDAGVSLTALTRAIRRVLAAGGYPVIDILVRDGFARAHHFARLLGFDRVGGLDLNGERFAIYERRT